MSAGFPLEWGLFAESMLRQQPIWHVACRQDNDDIFPLNGIVNFSNNYSDESWPPSLNPGWHIVEGNTDYRNIPNPEYPVANTSVCQKATILVTLGISLSMPHISDY